MQPQEPDQIPQQGQTPPPLQPFSPELQQTYQASTPQDSGAPVQPVAQTGPEAYAPPAYVPTQSFNPAQQTAPAQWQPQAGQQPYVAYDQGPIIMGAAGNNGSPGFTASLQPKSHKKLFIFSGAAIAVLLAFSGAVFGLYLPNTPSNVYSTGINRSGKAISSIVVTSTTPQKLANYKTSEFSGNITANFEGGTYAGDFDTKFDQTSLNGGLNFTIKDTTPGSTSAAKTLSAKVLSQIASGNSLPDIYFQLNGLKALGLDSTIPGISAYDGQWILVGSDYLKSISASLSHATTSQSQITSSDIAELARTATAVTTDYVFSTDKNTAVFTEQKFVGKEKVDGINTYHYTVTVDLPHAKAYCTTLTNSLLATNAYKKLSGATAAEITNSQKSSAKSCNDRVSSSFKGVGALDMWIDAKYKLIHKIRLTDPTDKGSYFELGQTYTGGNNLSLFSNIHEATDKVDATATLDTNMQTNAIKAALVIKSTSADNPANLKINLSSKRSTTPVTITKPANAVKIQDVLTKIGLGSIGTTSDTAVTPTGNSPATGDAADSLRQADIDSIQTQLEAYFQTAGSYPSLAQLNSASWRTTNMPSLPATTLQNPGSTITTLVAGGPTLTEYSYAPGGCDSTGGNCASYSLSALLSDGTTYGQANLD